MKISLDIPEDAFKTCYSSPEKFASALRKAAAIAIPTSVRYRKNN
ncbi:hypothetical protein [Scytonema sp. UIC 10036]|nr:hypothetical protein [Scytonema sp. UIC 10036]